MKIYEVKDNICGEHNDQDNICYNACDFNGIHNFTPFIQMFEILIIEKSTHQSGGVNDTNQ